LCETRGESHMVTKQNKRFMRRMSQGFAAAALALVQASVHTGADPAASRHKASTNSAETKFETDAVPAPCHPNPHSQADMAAVAHRGDLTLAPQPLRDRLIRLAGRPHTFLPLQVFAEADRPSLLF